MPGRGYVSATSMREAVTGFGPTQRVVVESRDVVFNEDGLPPPTLESRQQSADADELDVQPALICKHGSGVEVCPWGSQQGHEAEFEM